jgi:flavin reductase (DIM6/NTAB) family NADH-FMN oxidoreductase RutF
VRPELTSQEFRDIIGTFASGVTVITTTAGGAPFGTTASAVTSLSLEPPMLLVCLDQASSTRAAIVDVGTFVVNILSEDQADLALRFASKLEDKFAGVETITAADGRPLIGGALAHLECRVVEEVVGGTHTVFHARVEVASRRQGAPLAYFRGAFGRLTTDRDDEIFEELRRRVIQRQLPVDQPLRLDDVASELGAPRGSVHHALSALAAERYVERRPGGSFVVAPVTVEAILDALPALFTIWLGSMQATIGCVGRDDLAELRRRLDVLQLPVADDVTVEEVFAWRTEFITGFLDLTGSDIVAEAWRRADVPIMVSLLWAGGGGPAPSAYEDLHRRFAEVLDAYEAADADGVNAAVRAARDFVMQLFRDGL